MMRTINPELRQRIARRAHYLSEYCLIHEEDTFWGCEVDHIISLKHDGQTHAHNLAYACALCNRYKGSDIGSLIPHTDTFCRFFNPRTDRWYDHFQLEHLVIQPLTDIGEVTSRILQFNAPDRLLERLTLADEGRYPDEMAMQHIQTPNP